jgi:hypothetical protein
MSAASAGSKRVKVPSIDMFEDEVADKKPLAEYYQPVIKKAFLCYRKDYSGWEGLYLDIDPAK